LLHEVEAQAGDAGLITKGVAEFFFLLGAVEASYLERAAGLAHAIHPGRKLGRSRDAIRGVVAVVKPAQSSTIEPVSFRIDNRNYRARRSEVERER
jgi:hypothetical protein